MAFHLLCLIFITCAWSAVVPRDDETQSTSAALIDDGGSQSILTTLAGSVSDTLSIAAPSPTAAANTTGPIGDVVVIQGAPTASPTVASGYAAKPADADAIIAKMPALNASFMYKDPVLILTLTNDGDTTIQLDISATVLDSGYEAAGFIVTAANQTISPNPKIARQYTNSQVWGSSGLALVSPHSSVDHQIPIHDIYALDPSTSYNIVVRPTFNGGYIQNDVTSGTDVGGGLQVYQVRVLNNVFELDPSAGISTNYHPSRVMPNITGGASGSTSMSSRRDATSDDNFVLTPQNVLLEHNQFINCNAEDTQIVLKAIDDAKQMAFRGLTDTRYTWLREHYFGPQPQSDRWTSIMRNIFEIKVDPTQSPDPAQKVYFVCDRNGDQGPEEDYCNTRGYEAYTASYNFASLSYVFLCQKFFDQPDHNKWFPGNSWYAEEPYDRPTTIAHELTHASGLVTAMLKTGDVTDASWWSKALSWPEDTGDCYRYSCTVALASQGNDGGSDWQGKTAFDNAQNYAYYMKSIRDCYDGSYNGGFSCWYNAGG